MRGKEIDHLDPSDPNSESDLSPIGSANNSIPLEGPLVGNVLSSSDTENDAGKSSEILWKTPGFHRPLAGIFYNLIYILIAAVFGILISVWLLPNLIYPFPEAMGFENVTTSIFMIYFVVLDLGIGAAIDRFVAAEKITSPRKSLQYIQFFIWYQSFSGLFQITTIVVYILYFLPQSELAYASWLFLVYSLIQYPGFLGVFRGALEAFQRFDKANLIGFIQYQLFENFFRVVFILLGRQYGVLNPQIGEVLGAAIGSMFGRVLKDYVSALLALVWLRPIIKEIDPKHGLLALFFVEFDKEVIKKCLVFGLKVLIPSLVYPLSTLISIAFIVRWLPNYSTILGLFTMGEMFSFIITTFSFPGIAAVISESYQNKKFRLTNNYIQQFFHWSSTLAGFMFGMMFIGATLIGVIAGANFALVGPIIQHFLVWRLMNMFCSIMDSLFVGTGKPEYILITNIVEQVVRLSVLYLMLVVFPSGWAALVYSLGLGWAAKLLLGYKIFKKKIFDFEINIWQTLIAVFLAVIVEALALFYLFQLTRPFLISAFGEILAAIVLMVAGLAIGPFLIYFPAYSFFGGLDNDALKTLKIAVKLSGPSKPIISFIYNVCEKVCSISPLHNRFPINNEGVAAEAMELELAQKESLGN